MKIAQVTPLYEAVPPKLYGGTERVVAHLTDALVDLGHEVTLFASAEARTKARLVPVRDQAIRLDPSPLKSDLAAHMTMLAEVMDRIDDFDVVHFHTDMIQFPMFRKYAGKTLTTLHGRGCCEMLVPFRRIEDDPDRAAAPEHGGADRGAPREGQGDPVGLSLGRDLDA